MMESIVSIVSAAALLLSLSSAQITFHITPLRESPCPYEDCLTISEFASETNRYSNTSDNLTLVFLPGEHVLNSTIFFQMLNCLTILGCDSSLPSTASTIVCNGTSAAFMFEDVRNVEINTMAFVSCGFFDRSVYHNYSLFGNSFVVTVPNVVPTVSAVQVENLHLVSCSMVDNTLPLLLNRSKALMQDCKFINNTGSLGGALALHQSTLVFLEHNTITNNNAIIGGGVFANRSELVIMGCTTFSNNTAGRDGGGLVVFYSTIISGKTTNCSLHFTMLCTDYKSWSIDKNQTRYDIPHNLSTYQNMQTYGNCAFFGQRTVAYSSLSRTVMFERNRAEKHFGRGGAVLALSSTWKSANAIFVNNSAGRGGAVYSSKCHFEFGLTTSDESPDSTLENSNHNTSHGFHLCCYKSTRTLTNNCMSKGGGKDAASSSVLFVGANVFEHNRATRGGAISTWDSTLTFTGNSTFQKNWAVYDCAIICAYHSTFSFIGYSLFINNFLIDAASDGGAISICEESWFHFKNNVSFVRNKARNGGALHIGSKSAVVFSGIVALLENTADFSGGGIYLTQWSRCVFYSDVTGEHTNNVAGESGGWIYAENSHLLLQGRNTVVRNMAGTNGGAVFLLNTRLWMTGNSTFVENRANYSGGALYAEYNSEYIDPLLVLNLPFQNTFIIIEGYSTIANNSAFGHYGGGLYMISTTVQISGNTSFIGNWARKGGGGMYAENTLFTCSGVSWFEGNKAYIYGGGLHSVNADIRFEGMHSFINNWSEYGGGMAIQCDTHYSPLYITANASVAFYHNYAADFGGGIFIMDGTDNFRHCQQDLILHKFCFIRLAATATHSTSDKALARMSDYSLLHTCIGSVSFEGNSAEGGGALIYGGSLHECRVEPSNEYLCDYAYCANKTCYISGIEAVAALTRKSVKELTANGLNIVSDMYKVCICNESRMANCKHRPVNRTAFPGETISLRLAVVGENNKILPGTSSVRAEISESEGAWLDKLENTQTTSSCGSVEYTVFTNTSKSAKLTISTDGPCGSLGILLDVLVDFLYCPLGFMPSDSGLCVCEQRLQRHSISCDINDRSFTHNGEIWLGISHESNGLILHPHCSFDYCKSKRVSFTLNSTDLQCAHERSGRLCGACRPGLSLNLGSSRCSSCSNLSLLLFLPFAIAGFALVIFLFTCKVTVAAGTTSGLIFYANVIAVNRSVFFPSGEANILTVFIAWLNLDLGLETCFYDGMDVYTQTWLQFLFPLYIWVLVGLITITSKYSTKIARIIGRTNPIAVLATLFLLSYTKLLRTIIATLSFTTLDYPNDRTVTVWVYDGNIGYFQGKHIPLFLAGLLAFLLLFLPYTLVLLFGQWIEARSNYKVLRWANTHKIRSFLDAYHAPYKIQHRYWPGLMLLIRFALFIISAVIDINSPRDPSVNFLALGIVCAVLMVWVWNAGRVYKTRYNNILESSFILNLAILSLASYQVQVEGESQAAVVYTSVSVAFATFVTIIAYHVLERVLESRVWRISIARKLQHLRNKVASRQEPQSVIELSAAPTATPPHVPTTFVDLRESLLESQH